MSQTVLVPIDGSPLSYRALNHALEKFPEGEVVVLHVADLYEPWLGREDDSTYEYMAGSDEWYAMEQEVAEELFSEAEAIASEYSRELTTEMEIGDPQRIIPDYAMEEDVDHIVIGVHGREEPERSVFGRVAETVVFRSPVPVTIMR